MCWGCDDEKHALVNGKDAVKMGLISESYRTNSNFCAYKYCHIAAQNKAKKCGEGAKRQQAARAIASGFCIHPKCMRGYHELCWSIVHRLTEP